MESSHIRFETVGRSVPENVKTGPFINKAFTITRKNSIRSKSEKKPVLLKQERRREMLGFLPFNLAFIIVLFAGLLLLIAGLLQWLWNITMPDVFNLKEITYWQAFRLLIISGILFGSANVTL